jgi:PAS domain S-box-containing protein
MANAQILVVEDEVIVAKDIQITLKNLGYAVSAVVSSGEDAIKKAAATHPDLVLMDIVLEGAIDGLEAAENIRNNFDIPVVYLTAYSDEKTLHRAKITEPYGYILKPFQERELHTTIEMALYKHKMERQLRESEQRFITTLKSIGDAVLATDMKGLVTFMNPVAETLTGWKQEDATGKPLKDVFNIIDAETGKQADHALTRILREGVVVGLADNTILMAKDETKRPINACGSFIRDAKGNIYGVVLVFHDITDRKRAEETVDKLRRLNELILNSAGEGIFGLDLQGNTIFSNPAAGDMLGWKLEELVDQSLHDIIHHSRPDGTKYSKKECPICAVFRDGVTRHVSDELFWRKDGTSFPVEYISTPIREHGEIVGAVVTFKDITERTRLEDSLLRSKKRLRSLSSSLLVVQEQERKKISQELHDDLGQILTAVLLDITQAKKLEIPVASGISSFLDRIQAGTEESLQRVRSLSAALRPRVLDHLGLEAAVASFLEDFRERTGLNVVEEIHVGHNDIPEPITIAIYRILQEATTNIVKHAAANQIIVQLYSDQHTVALSVTDDGQGFDPQSLPTDQGLGIMGMRERTGQLGGAFRIGSAPGHGTIVYAEIALSAGKSIT